MSAIAATLAPSKADRHPAPVSSDAQPCFTVGEDSLTLLDTGRSRLDAVLRLIEEARSSLRVLFYIYADDASGKRVTEALAEAARRGVDVRLVIDGFGAHAPADLFAALEAAGGSVCRFEPRFGRRYLLRNHQKLLLADAEDDRPRVIIGGFNIEDDYFSDGADAWRDLGLLMEGRAAGRLSGYFDELDAWVRQPRPKLRRLNRDLGRWSETSGPLRWLIGGPTRRLSPWARAVRADLRRAHRIGLVAGYFTPSPTMLRRLDRVGRQGLDVRVVTAARSDNDTTIAAARFTYAGLLKKGVRIFEYTAAKLHTKLYAIDDVVHLGSANFDMRSLFINLELMLRVDDPAFAAHVHAYVDGEVARSNEITEDEYRERTGPITRARQFLSYLLVAVVDPGLSRGLNLGPGE